jgi:SAM-dependent methyltransferase
MGHPLKVPLKATISGSLRRFLPEMEEAARELKEVGISVLSPRAFQVIDEKNGFVFLEGDEGEASTIQNSHLQAITNSDFLLLVCPGGYLGSSASLEVGYALALGIPIFALSPPAEPVIFERVKVVDSAAMAVASLLNDHHRNIYDELAPEYAVRASALKEITVKALSDLLPLLKPSSLVLDVGCGAGLVSEEMIRAGHKVVALDISEEMIKIVRQRVPLAQTVLGDYLEMEFPEQFDAIIGFAFIHLFPSSIAQTITEKLYQDIKPGGLLYLGTTTSERSGEGFEEKGDYLNAPTRFRKHWRAEEFSEALIEAGFQEIKKSLHHDPFGKTWLDIIARKK